MSSGLFLKIQEDTKNAMRAKDSKLLGTIRLLDRKSTRLNSSHIPLSRMPSSA